MMQPLSNLAKVLDDKDYNVLLASKFLKIVESIIFNGKVELDGETSKGETKAAIFKARNVVTKFKVSKKSISVYLDTDNDYNLIRIHHQTNKFSRASMGHIAFNNKEEIAKPISELSKINKEKGFVHGLKYSFVVIAQVEII